MLVPSRPNQQQYHAVLRIEYDGTPFSGWVRQPDRSTIEGELLDAFAALGCTEVELRCAGRTDAGVHATAQVADARYVGAVPPERLPRALARVLPDELAVVAAMAAPVGFNARSDATSRAYEYRILTRSIHSPVRATRVLHHPRPLDRDVLDAAAAAVIGQHTFSTFTPARTEHTYFERTIVTSRFVDRGDELIYEVRANAFLRRMVRMLVGTMLAVGRGELTLEEFIPLLDGDPRSEAVTTALPHALCLVDVTWEPFAGLPLPPNWRMERPRRPHAFGATG